MKKLVLYLPLFYPNKERFYQILDNIDELKIDYVEIGLPSKDPYIDGEAISKAHSKIINDKYENNQYLDALLKIKQKYSFKVVLMGYFEEFKQFPMFFEEEYTKYFDAILCIGLPSEIKISYNIPILNELDDKENFVKKLNHDPLFAYVMSSAGKTGSGELKNNYIETIKKIKDFKNIDCFVGFNIRSGQDVKTVIQNGADGAIIGSQFIKEIEKNREVSYLNEISKELE